MRSAGRPPSPTTHPRTKPEANEFALRNRGTGDWFRHDGKNVEEQPVPPQRLQGPVAPEVAEKYKGESEKWYEHDSKTHVEAKHNPRVHSKEAQDIHDKIAGTEEAWFKMEDNLDYHSDRPKSRVTTVQGQEVVEKMERMNTNDWFKHEHKAENGQSKPAPPQPAKSRTGPTPYAGSNKQKQARAGEWYEDTSKTVGGSDADNVHKSRVHTADAQENLERNRGSASNWYQHSQQPYPSAHATPRMRPTTSDSENWFNHDANRGMVAQQPKPKLVSSAAKENAARNQGDHLQNAMQGKPDTDVGAPAPRVKPEASDNAQKNVQGMMSKYLSQDANKGYNSSRAGGRIIKPEAASNAERNKGSLGNDLTGGYASGPAPKRDAARVKPEAAGFAQRERGSMASVMSGNGPGAQDRPMVNRTKPEAEVNKTRNAGAGYSLFGGGNAYEDRPKSRGGSASARAAADRNKGSIGSLLGMG